MSAVMSAGEPAPRGDYHALFDYSPVSVAMVSVRPEPHFIAASRGFLAAFDLRRAALVGRPISDVLAPEAYSKLQIAISQCLATRKSVHTRVELRNPRGRRSVPVAVHSPGAPGFSGQILLEAQGEGHWAHPREHRMSSTLDRTGGDGQSMEYIHDLKTHRIRYVEGGLAKRLGLSGGKLHYDDFAAMLHPDDLAATPAYEAARAALADDAFATSTVRVRDAEGVWRLISFRSRVFRRTRKGAVRLVLGCAMDISDFAAAAGEATEASVLRAEHDERARLGRELHDSTSQYLVAADLGLARVLKSSGLPASVRERLSDVQGSLGAAQTEIRTFSYLLHTPELRELGLLKTIERFCAGFARRSGLEIDCSGDGLPPDLPPNVEHALFRVFQESLMNAYRHAFARRVSVSLQLAGGDLMMELRDDGIGVDGVERFEHGGIGISGMKARMRSIGGDLSFDYQNGGLAVLARAPLQPGLAAALPQA